jgi:hypothetical protein
MLKGSVAPQTFSQQRHLVSIHFLLSFVSVYVFYHFRIFGSARESIDGRRDILVQR